MNKSLKNLTFSAVLLAFALVLPFLTGNNTELGNAFCLMHIPVLLCGYACGWSWGGAVGFTAPLLRSFLVGKPPFPNVALPMAFELAAYGLIAGLLYRLLPKKIPYVYVSLSVSLLLGRVVLGMAKYLVLGFKNIPFGLEGFITGSVLPAWPGVLIQFALIPPIVVALKRARLFAE